MREIKFRVWHLPEKKMYYRGYQKLTHILLCDSDPTLQHPEGLPQKRAPYTNCIMMECTDLEDLQGNPIYEGDRLRILWQGREYQGEVGDVPDMFRSRNLHPLHSLLEKLSLPLDGTDLTFEILGNRYEHTHEK